MENSKHLPARPTYARRSAGFAQAGAASAKAGETPAYRQAGKGLNSKSITNKSKPFEFHILDLLRI
jgi:hypothetical protein